MKEILEKVREMSKYYFNKAYYWKIKVQIIDFKHVSRDYENIQMVDGHANLSKNDVHIYHLIPSCSLIQ